MSLITVGLRLGGLKRLACCRLSLDLGLGGPPKTTNNSTLRQLHTCRVLACIKSPAPDEDKEKSAVITRGYFDRGKEEQNKENFEGAIDIFTHKDSRRRGSVEFIYAAMRNMEHFGVHRWYQLPNSFLCIDFANLLGTLEAIRSLWKCSLKGK